jgi:hypothetical protein
MIAFGEALSSAVGKASDNLSGFAQKVAALIDQNQSLVVSIVKGIAIFGVAAAAMIGLGLVIKGLATGIGGVLIPIRMLGGLLGAAVSLFAALLSPIGLATAAVLGIGGAILYTSGLGSKALGWLGERFGVLLADAQAAWQGIADALAAGDISLAARVLWSGLKMEFQKGYAWVMQGWLSVKTFLLKTLQGGIDGASAAWTIFTSWMRTAWTKTVGFLQGAWARFSAQFERATTRTGSVLAGWWLKIQESMAASPQEAEKYRQAQRQLPQQTEAMLIATSREETQRLAELDALQQAELQKINDDRDTALAAIGQNYEGVATALDQQRQADIAALQADLDNARADFHSAVGEAQAKRSAAAAAGDNPAPDEGGTMGAIKKTLDDAIAQLGAATSGAKSIFGSFHVAAAYGIGPQDKTAEIAENTKKTAEGVDRMSRKMDKPLVYGI